MVVRKIRNGTMSGVTSLLPVSTNGIGFLLLCSFLVLFAWGATNTRFVVALAATGALMTLTWVTPFNLAVVIIFLFLPYPAMRVRWGRGLMAGNTCIVVTLVIQLAFFAAVKRYPWLDLFAGFPEPVFVIGISYILFRQVHLLVDAPFLKTQPINLVQYTAFMLSPWTLIAGPIQQYDDFQTGLQSIGRPNRDAILKAAHRILNGLLKAFVVAPLFLPSSDIRFLERADATWADFFIVLYSYPIYLYLNFSGYMDIVIGASALCGFHTLPENFNRPYLARNIQDFWMRWHISLGVWIRRYVFTPLSVGLVKRSPQSAHPWMIALAVMVTFFLVGLWHGTTSNYIVFGLLHGLAVLTNAGFNSAAGLLLEGERRRQWQESKPLHLVSVIACFHYVCFTFLFLDNSADSVFSALKRFFVGAG